MSQNQQKQAAAQKALDYVKEDQVVGVGTGSTVNFFIEGLASKKHLIEGAVSSSKVTEQLLRTHHIPILDPNSLSYCDIYVDGADEATKQGYLIKGGGAALTGEKIITAMSEQFICIIDQSKYVDILGRFPLPIEVIPLARSYVAREIVKLGGNPVYRQGVVTDYGNVILDVHGLTLTDPIEFEKTLNQIAGVVTNGLFAKRHADILLIGEENQTRIIPL